MEVFLDHSSVGMNKDQYLRMVEQTGEEIDWDRCPPDAEDFPDTVLDALNIFHSLGDRIYPDVGYIGKDFTNLPLLMVILKRSSRNGSNTVLMLTMRKMSC